MVERFFGALEPASPRVPPSFITKYNRYVDNILERINKVLRTGFDPVNVRLHSVKTKETKKKQAAKKNKTKTKGKKKEDKNKSKTRGRALEPKANEVNVTISNVTVVKATPPTTVSPVTTTMRPKNVTEIPQVVNRASGNKEKDKKKEKTPSKDKKKNGSTKNTKKSSKPRAKATLYGMASLKRSDDVTVNLMSSHTTVKSKFTIGPLTLKVEKEFGRGNKKELRSATATTTEMVGKINLRLNHGGRATLHSIHVMQPNLLRVDATDDHDKTREFVWKRSSHIAQIVSQKLTKAARSLLQPEPQKAKQKKKKPANDSFFSYFI